MFTRLLLFSLALSIIIRQTLLHKAHAPRRPRPPPRPRSVFLCFSSSTTRTLRNSGFLGGTRACRECPVPGCHKGLNGAGRLGVRLAPVPWDMSNPPLLQLCFSLEGRVGRFSACGQSPSDCVAVDGLHSSRVAECIACIDEHIDDSIAINRVQYMPQHAHRRGQSSRPAHQASPSSHDSTTARHRRVYLYQKFLALGSDAVANAATAAPLCTPAACLQLACCLACTS